MSLQKIPHDTTKYRMNPVELANIANRNRIGTISGTAGSQEYTSGSSTFTVPSGVTSLTVTMWGGGGSGASSDAISQRGGGGGGGGSIVGYTYAVTPGQSISYSVGAGGSARTAGLNQNGYDGGNTTFGILTAYGGIKGTYGVDLASSGGAGGNATDGTNIANGGTSTSKNGGVYNSILYGGGCGGGTLISNNTTGTGYSSGGSSGSNTYVGSGGGSYGTGGNGAKYPSGPAGTAGTDGGGGGGSTASSYPSTGGGNGKITLSWNVTTKHNYIGA